MGPNWAILQRPYHHRHILECTASSLTAPGQKCQGASGRLSVLEQCIMRTWEDFCIGVTPPGSRHIKLGGAHRYLGRGGISVFYFIFSSTCLAHTNFIFQLICSIPFPFLYCTDNWGSNLSVGLCGSRLPDVPTGEKKSGNDSCPLVLVSQLVAMVAMAGMIRQRDWFFPAIVAPCDNRKRSSTFSG
jgi:hypothetical protein